MKYLSCLCLVWLTSCNSKEKINDLEIITSDSRLLDIYNWKREFLNFDAAFLNNKAPFKCTKIQLFESMGYPTQRSSFENIKYLSYKPFADSLYYYNNTIFFTQSDRIIPCIIDFHSTPVEIHYPGITFSKNTQPDDIEKVFPLSYRLRRGKGAEWEGYIQINTSNRDRQESVWFLTFKGGRLAKMALYFTPSG